MSDDLYISAGRLAGLIRAGLEVQAEVENYGEGTITVTGPVDLDELADFIREHA